MTERLITNVSFIPKASNVSDFDRCPVTTLSEYLKGTVSDRCGGIVAVTGVCHRKGCNEEHIKFKKSIDELIQSSFVMPESFVAHVRSQAKK